MVKAIEAKKIDKHTCVVNLSDSSTCCVMI
jgi:hypothetical protein